MTSTFLPSVTAETWRGLDDRLKSLFGDAFIEKSEFDEQAKNELGGFDHIDYREESLYFQDRMK
jgi:hypothetical protein